jgi:hypothetical protein
MRSMAIDRRRLITGFGAFAIAAGLPPRLAALAALAGEEALYLSAARIAEETYAVIVFTERGEILRRIPLPARGHDVAVHPASGRGAVFARRPGVFGLGFDLQERTAPVAFACPPDRHFYGHGFYAPDGRLLYATENDFEGRRGVIGVYDATDGYRRLGELPSHGVGPHEAVLMPDGQTIAVANGGIDTHPVSGRIILEMATMRPSLAFVDRETGELRASQELPAELHQLSIRHLGIDQRSRVWFGGQWEGDFLDAPALVGFGSPDEAIGFAEMDPDTSLRLKGYIGAMASSRDGSLIAATSPRGGQVIYWDAATGREVGRRGIADVCGVGASEEEGFVVTSGAGELGTWSPEREAMTTAEGLAFDNHLLSMTGLG